MTKSFTDFTGHEAEIRAQENFNEIESAKHSLKEVENEINELKSKLGKNEVIPASLFLSSYVLTDEMINKGILDKQKYIFRIKSYYGF